MKRFFLILAIAVILAASFSSQPAHVESDCSELFDLQLAAADTGWSVIDSCGVMLEIYVAPDNFITADTLDLDLFGIEVE